MPVLKTERASPGSHRGYLWSYGIPWSTVVFDYQPTRSGQHATEFLKEFQGVLQSDRYAGYNAVREREDIIDVACWAHARRKFKEAEKTADRRTRSVLKKISKLYAVEKRAREERLDPEARTHLQVKHSAPVLEALNNELAEMSVTVRPSTPLGKAIGYTHASWLTLTEYVARGGIEIDHNLLENSIRPIALGRKNYLFAGSPAGAEAAATLYSITEPCRRIGIDPLAYLKDVLNQLATSEPTEELILSLRGRSAGQGCRGPFPVTPLPSTCPRCNLTAQGLSPMGFVGVLTSETLSASPEAQPTRLTGRRLCILPSGVAGLTQTIPVF